MSAALSIAAARLGYSGAAAEAALGALQARVGLRGEQLYVFRSGAQAGAAGGEAAPARSRLILAFRSADAALGFAQAGGLGRSPRLAALSMGQLLAALLRRPDEALLRVADDDAARPPAGHLPAGVTITRAELLGLLAAGVAGEHGTVDA